jgi:hypothetical protein
LILQVLVHQANIQDYRGGKLLLAPLKGEPLPAVSQDALRRADEIRMASLLSSEANSDRGGIGQRDLPSDGLPATEMRAL